MSASTIKEMNERAREAAWRVSAPWISKGYKPTGFYTYTNASGQSLYWRFRLDHPGYPANPKLEKIVRPLQFIGPGPDDFVSSMPKERPSDGWPLYGLADLVIRPDESVLIVEGEKCADAVWETGLLAVTSGGAQSVSGADWSLLKGRHCIVWRDNDKSGFDFARRVTAKVQALGCTVEWMDIDSLGLPEKGDCVDWLATHPGAKAADLLGLPRVVPQPTTKDDSGASTSTATAPRLTIPFSKIEAKPIRWLWPGRIARGKLTMIAGNPGLGKSQTTADIAARVSTGGRWPITGEKCDVGHVLMVSAEDDPEDTIRPRLDAVGADVSQCHHLRAPGFTLDAVGLLETAIDRMPEPPALITIDPITAFMGSADSHNNAEVRAALTPLSELAIKIGAAVVLVSHLNKSGGADALSRVMGSLAFVAAVRGAFLVVKDPDDLDRRLFLPLKNNLGKDNTGYSFGIKSVKLSGDIETSCIAWDKTPIVETADEVMERLKDLKPGGALEAAKQFLIEKLAAGPMPMKKLKELSGAEGHSFATLKRAADALGVHKDKDGAGPWFWRLSKEKGEKGEDAQDAPDSQGESVEPLYPELRAVPPVPDQSEGEDAQEAQGALEAQIMVWEEGKA